MPEKEKEFPEVIPNLKWFSTVPVLDLDLILDFIYPSALDVYMSEKTATGEIVYRLVSAKSLNRHAAENSSKVMVVQADGLIKYARRSQLFVPISNELVLDCPQEAIKRAAREAQALLAAGGAR